MRAPTMCSGRMHVKTAACDASPCSGVGGAAFEETPVAVTAGRFYWPTRSREGAGSMERKSPVERNSLGNASPWDARRTAPRGTGGRSPPAHFGNFSAVKSSPPEANKPGATVCCRRTDPPPASSGRCGLQGSAACGRKSDRKQLGSRLPWRTATRAGKA